MGSQWIRCGRSLSHPFEHVPGVVPYHKIIIVEVSNLPTCYNFGGIAAAIDENAIWLKHIDMTYYAHSDFDDSSSAPSRRQSTVSTSTVSSASTSILFQSPATSPGSRKPSWQLYDDVVRLELSPYMTVSFLKNGQLFKLRYSYIDVCKDSTGALKCLELGGGLGQQAPFIHAFHNTKLPVPHLEHPKDSAEYPLRVSFLEHQTVQTSQVVFMTQLSYKFENWEDCVSFQELLLCSKLLFIGGMAEAKSKGRGEECISQNLRILRGQNGKRVMLFFANSQRKELKRYVSIPLNCVAHVKPPKKRGRAVSVDLNPNFDFLAQMRNIQIQFLDDIDSQSFCQLLSTDLTIG